MKTKRNLIQLCLLAMLGTLTLSAQTITDNFTEPSNWGTPYSFGGNMSVGSGRMNYTSTTTSESGAAIPRNLPLLPTTQDWSLKVDVHLDPFTLTTEGQFSDVFLGFGKTGDEVNTHVTFEFGRQKMGSHIGYYIGDDVRINGADKAGLFDVYNLSLSASESALRLDYNAANHTVTYYFDADGATGGYNWVAQGTANLASGTYNLGMGASDTFTIILVGSSAYQTVASGQAYLSNLVITIGTTTPTAPSITSQPVSITNNLGATANFTVTATGTAPLAFQWRFNGTNLANAGNISGTTTANLTITNLQTNDAGSYSVVITNSAGSVTSSVAALTIGADPLAAALDGSGLVWTTGGIASWFAQTATTHDGVDAARSGPITHSQESWMQTTVAGPGTLSFWWKVSSESGYDYLEFYLDGVLQSGRISGAVDWQQKPYTIVTGTHIIKWRYVKDGSVSSGSDAGWVDQVAFVPDVPTAPSITQQPQSRTNFTDTTAAFTVTATGTSPLFYQWLKNGTSLTNGGNISGVLTANLTITNVQSDAAADFTVIVTNAYGSVTSSVASLSVVSLSGQVLTNVARASAGATAAANSEFAANGYFPAGNTIDGNLGNYWAAIQGVSPWQLTVTFATNFPIVRLNLVEDGWDPAFSTSGRLEYNNGSGWQTITNFLKTSPGIDVNLSTPIFCQQVRFTGTAASAPGNWYNKVPCVAEFEAYAVLNSGGMSPSINIQPTDQTSAVGATATFSVAASGTSPLAYQWRFNGTNLANAGNISGVIATNLTIAVVQTNNAGNYTVVVTNNYGSVTSAVASLVVTQPSATNAVTLYTIVDLGDLPGGSDDSYAYALNDIGQVVGGSVTTNRTSAFIWDAANGMRDLGSIAGNNSVARGMNNSGMAVGQSGNPYAFRWDSTNGIQNLGNAGYPYCGATAINDTGAIAYNNWSYYGPPGKAYLQVDATKTWIGELTSGDWTRGFDINNQNEIVGGSYDSSYLADGYHNEFELAFRWSSASGIQSLGAVSPYTNSEAQAINNASQIVGFCYNSTQPFVRQPSTAFLWTTNGGMALLESGSFGVSNTIAWDINLAGIVVGEGQINGTNHALIWDSQQTISDLNGRILNKSGWAVISSAHGINSSGMIAGYGTRTNGVRHAFMLYPTNGFAPVITSQPVSLTNNVGTTSVFTVAVSGTDPLDYQWRFNGTNLTDGGNISGVTTTNFTIANLQTSNAGNYSVVVTNVFGSATSSVAALTVNVATNISMVVNVDARLYGDSATLPHYLMNLQAGKWKVTPVTPSMNTNALFTAWSYISSGNAWRWGLSIISQNTTLLNLDPQIWYATPELAFSAQSTNAPFCFSLAEPAAIEMFVKDNAISDNRGGLSFILERVSAVAPVITPPSQGQTNQFGFNITGSSNLVVVVEACTNLNNPVWQPVQTNTLTSGSAYFSDPQWTNYPSRFYRLRSAE